MKTLFLSTRGAHRARSIASAARILRRGGLVAFPTETVYGLGGHAFNARAVRKIFRVKGRPQDNPLIVHIASVQQIWQLVDSLPVMFWALAEKFMPGPLTIVVRKSRRVPAFVTAGLETIAVRIPDHPVARALLKATAAPIVAPSANISGRPSPTTASHVREDLDGRIDAILDGGSSRVGLESTVVDITGRVPIILRPGGVTGEQIQKALGVRVRLARPVKHRPKSPGMKYKHYAPRAEVVVFEGKRSSVWRTMVHAAARLQRRGVRVGAMAEDQAGAKFSEGVLFFSLGETGARGAARLLFRGFRSLDAQNVDMILCQGFSDEEIGAAVMNRLRKAATRRVRV